MAFRSSRRTVIIVSGLILALGAPIGVTAHAQCDPSQCTNPNAYRDLPATLAPRTFSTLKTARTYCRSEPIVWRTSGGQVYGAKTKGYGKIKPGFYMCKSHARTVARIEAESGQKPR